jgi:hypothetical protein
VEHAVDTVGHPLDSHLVADIALDERERIVVGHAVEIVTPTSREVVETPNPVPPCRAVPP